MLDAQGKQVADVVAKVETKVERVETVVVDKAKVVEAWLEEHVAQAVREMHTTHPLTYLKGKVAELVKAIEGL